MSSRLLYTIISFSLLGVALTYFLHLPSFFITACIVCGCMTAVFSFFFRTSFLLLISCAFITLALGSVRVSLDDSAHPHSLDASLGEKVHLVGVINDEVDKRPTSTRFLLSLPDVSSPVLVSTDPGTDLSYGDSVSVTGILEAPDNFTTDQGKEFDYVSYLAKDNIFYTVSFADVTKEGSHPPSRIKKALLSFKEKLMTHIEEVVPDPEGVFLGGITLGARTGIPETLRNDFITTGTIHIVALSGYNISIVAKYVQELFAAFFSYYTSLVMGALAIVAFVIMTGGQATAVRAGLMALFAVLAKLSGRAYTVGRALFIAGWAMVMWNPKILLYDISFQLSFLATLGIIYLLPPCERLLGKKEGEVPPRSFSRKIVFLLRDGVATTLAAQIAVAPFIAWKMGTFSIVSLPINILILPLIPWAMFLGFVIAFVGFTGTWFSLPFGYLAGALPSLVIAIISWGAKLPHALLSLSHFPLGVMLILYAMIVLWAYRFFTHSS